MEYRTLGSSGVIVSTMALGTMTFGTETDEAGCHGQLDQFVEAGGNLVDTADVYSKGVSEEIIGRWLAKRPPEIREQVVLATKGRFATGAGPNEVGLSRRHLTRALDASLGRLGVETIDLYQVHAWDPLTTIEETMVFLDATVRAGKIHYVGLSNFTGWQIQKAVDVADIRAVARPVTVQPQYNLLTREVEWEVVPVCEAEGSAFCRGPRWAAGWLTGKYHRDERPTGATRLGEDPNRGVEAYDRRAANVRTWDVLDAVEEIARSRGISMAQVALAWLVDRPTVCTVILGARTREQLARQPGRHWRAPVGCTRSAVSTRPATRAPADYPYGSIALEQRSRRIAGG